MTNKKTVLTGRKVRRPSTEVPILPSEEIAEICSRANNQRDACLVALLYLTGRRIEEVLPLRKQDFNVARPNFKIEESDYIVSFTTRNEKSWRREKQGKFNIPIVRKDKATGEDGVFYYEKIEPSFSLLSPSGKILGPYVMNHLDSIYPHSYLFPPYKASGGDHINQPRAYQIIRKLDERLWLHAMRHLAFTRWAEVYKANPTSMHELTFHKQFESTLKYIHDLEKKSRQREI